MSVDAKTLLTEAVERARARAMAAIAEAEAKEAAEKASKVDAWKQKIQDRANAERDARNKAGLDITEDFLKEIAAPFARFASRDDAAKLANIEISLRPGKTDQSASYSIAVKSPGSSPKLWHRASIDSLNETQRVQMERLRERGGIRTTSPVEMMQEIVKYRETLIYMDKLTQNAASPEEALEALGKVRDIISTLHLPKDD